MHRPEFRQPLDILKFADQIIGKQSNVLIDTNIYKHLGSPEQDHFNVNKDIHIITPKGEFITLQDIIDTFNKIEEQTNYVDHISRSYYYEGLCYDKNNDIWRIQWGS
jgi:hypothetical protein